MNMTVKNLPYAVQHVEPVSDVLAYALYDLPAGKTWVRHSTGIRAGSLPACVSCLTWTTYRYYSIHADVHIVYRRGNGQRGVYHDVYSVVEDERNIPEVQRYGEEV